MTIKFSRITSSLPSQVECRPQVPCMSLWHHIQRTFTGGMQATGPLYVSQASHPASLHRWNAGHRSIVCLCDITSSSPSQVECRPQVPCMSLRHHIQLTFTGGMQATGPLYVSLTSHPAHLHRWNAGHRSLVCLCDITSSSPSQVECRPQVPCMSL